MNQFLIKIKKKIIFKAENIFEKKKILFKRFILFLSKLLGYLFLGFVLSLAGLFALTPFLYTVNPNDPSELQRLIGNSNLIKYVFFYGVAAFSLTVISYYKNKLRFFSIVILFYWFAGLGLSYVLINSAENVSQPAPVSTIFTLSPTPTPQAPTSTAYQQPAPAPVNNDPWGIAKQVSEYTWTIRVGKDERMATPQEIYDALNLYRERNGVRRLNWSGELASYAQERAEFFNKIGNLDEHKGFIEYTNNIDNLRRLAHWRVGENSSIGYRVFGVHLIEWVYAGDKPHDDNQKDPIWVDVGVGVSGTATNLIFGSHGM